MQTSPDTLFNQARRSEADPDRARKLYTQAARLGHTLAQCRLAKIYLNNGRRMMALELFRMAANKECPDAQFALGEMLLDGAQPQEGVEWIRRAAGSGHRLAQLRLAEIYIEGKHAEPNPAKASYFLHKAAQHGSAEAQLKLADLYSRGAGVQQNDEEAFRLRQAAAPLAEAQLQLANMYMTGRGTSQDRQQAQHLLEQAAEQGNAQAIFELGWLLEKSKAKKDYLVYYDRAARMGHPMAQLRLGLCYAAGGQGILIDRVRAYMWISLAAARGCKQAENELLALSASMDPEDIMRGQKLALSWKPSQSCESA